MLQRGFLAKLDYKVVKTGFNPARLRINSTGSDYTDESVRKHFLELHFSDQIVRCVNRLFEIGRDRALVFTRFVEEAEYVVQRVPQSAIVTSDTPKKQREAIVSDFKAGKIKALMNVNIYGIGFDYPALANVVLAAPTMSLARYYQWCGRAFRPHPSKESAFIIDMVGLVEKFGQVENLVVANDGGNKWFIHNNGRRLTNVYFPR